jgi:hypothetical protein
VKALTIFTFMRELSQINFGVRSQAVLIFTMAVAWGFSFLGMISEMDSKSSGPFWAAIFFFTPFVMPVFAVILMVSHRRNGGGHRWLVRSAMLAAFSPWLLWLWISFAP